MESLEWQSRGDVIKTKPEFKLGFGSSTTAFVFNIRGVLPF
jgi:hypothetical protein